MKHARRCICTREPDYSGIITNTYYWEHTWYGGDEEIVPKDSPPPNGKFIILTHYVDANLMLCILIGRSVTDIMYLLNGTLIDSFSKKQATIETAIYGSEYIAACKCVE